MKSRPSIDADARQAGVSIATVSRVLNGSPRVAEPTRQKVQATIDCLGFSASLFGRGLSTGRSGVLVMMVPSIANSFFAEIVRGAATCAAAQDYMVLPIGVEGVTDDREGALLNLAGTLADGLINLVPMAARPGWLSKVKGRPWVHCSEPLPAGEAPFVSIDHTLAATEAVQYLINCGHRRIALINGDPRLLYAQQRMLGYKAALVRAGLEPVPELLINAGPISYAAGEQAIAQLLVRPELPSAIFAAADVLAVGAINGLRRAGIRVPDDVAVVGFDDLPMAGVFEPSLTTIAQPMSELGAAAVELVLARLAGECPDSRWLPHRLVVRKSG